MSGLNNGSSGLFSGVSGLAIAATAGSGLYNKWSGLGGGPGGPLPVNTIPPSITGGFYEGDDLTFVPGTWTGAISYEYRILNGDVAAPADPVEVLLDWTAATSGEITGITTGDYLWIQERATGVGGSAIATATSGHGPMEELTPADASIIGSAGLDTTAQTSATTYTFDMTITSTPRRQLYVALQAQGTSGGATDVTWSDVTAEGVALSFIEAFSFTDATRICRVEIWGLAGSTVPTGAGVTISATRSASTNTMRSQLAAIAVGNTSENLATASDVAQQTSATDATSYAFNVTTSVNKRLVLGFVSGQYTSNTLTTTTFTDNSTGWTTSLDPWISGAISRSASAVGWMGVLTRAIATASTVSLGWLRTSDSGGNQRYGVATTIDLPGDNS